ncbi:uncharacterized protein [Amphiura filiformis]|uniref:uncharacterized protein isoform X2 n=1 Tax=Amphiura filiformis TaxID=82378 RepID=UPI003B22686B
MVEETRAYYLLKRCGAPSTCEGVVDVFRLSKSRNVIGRNTAKVDFFLNSTINKCLISRHHAEILVAKKEGTGVVQLHIKDCSLNGTFVNDVKIPGTAELKAGDIVTFGHLSGAGIKPGTRSPQLNSEFSFVVQEISSDPSLGKPSVLNDAVQTFKEPPSSPLNVTIRATNPLDVSPLPTQPALPKQSNVKSPALLNKSAQLQTTPNNRNTEATRSEVKDDPRSGVKVDPHFDKVTSQGRAGMMVGIPGFDKLANSPTSVNGATASVNVTGSGTRGQPSTGARGQPSTTPVAKSPLSTQICSTPQRKVERIQSQSGSSSKPLVYILPKPSSSPTTPTTSRHNPKSSPSSSSSIPKPLPQTPTHTVKGTSILKGVMKQVSRTSMEENHQAAGSKNISKDSGIYDDFRELDDEEDMDSDGSDEDIFALASDIQTKVTNFTNDDEDDFSAHIPDSQNNNNIDLNESPIPGLDIIRNPSVLGDGEAPGSPVFDRCPPL